MIELAEDVAFEYLIDGGVVVAALSEARGDYWVMSAPAGLVWREMWGRRSFTEAAGTVAEALHISLDEAETTTADVCRALQARGVVSRWNQAASAQDPTEAA